VQGRNATTQAILKLRGKPLNVAGAKLASIVGNQEILTLLNVLGTGFGSSFDISKLTFHKIIIMADADVDGMHIQCLLLTFFHEMLPDLVKGGYVYIAQPPLYKVVYKKQDVWLLDDAAKDAWLTKHPDAVGLEFKRFKGLGEMNPKDLKETTLDPNRRTLMQVGLNEIDLAKKLVFQLMESKDAGVRREFLEKHGGSWLELGANGLVTDTVLDLEADLQKTETKTNQRPQTQFQFEDMPSSAQPKRGRVKKLVDDQPDLAVSAGAA
jgi:DNA gyrase subunit B